MQSILNNWQEQIKAAAARAEPLCIRGGGSKSFAMPARLSATLDTRAFTGIVEYAPEELVIVVRAGTALAVVEQTMKANGQMLAFEAPHFSPTNMNIATAATIGGAVATNLSGPRRPYSGALRDFVLGAKVIDGKGDHLSFGGKVMKNVAGFDVSRLLAGSWGSLGVITETAFKCLPLPQASDTRVFELGAADAILRMNEWLGAAYPITGSVWFDGRLTVRWAGAQSAVSAAANVLGGEPLADAEAWWAAWRDHTHPFFQGDMPLIRASVKSTAAYFDFSEYVEHEQKPDQAIDFGGAQRWLRAPALMFSKVQAWAKDNGGHACVFRDPLGGAAKVFSMDGLSLPLFEVQKKITLRFDPYGVFSKVSKA